MPVQFALTNPVAGVVGAWIVAVSGATLFLLLSRVYLVVRHRIRCKSVFANSFLQPPGYARRSRLRTLCAELHALLAAVALLPLLFAMVLLAKPAGVVAGFTALQTYATLVTVTAIAAYFIQSLIRVALEVPAVRYALQANMAVSHGLERVTRRDFCVFNDVGFGTKTLCTMIVGKQGVFVLSSYVHPRKGHDAHQQVTARFDGSALAFPDGTRVALTRAAKEQATLAARSLSKTVGKTIHACPVLAVPGWRIECVQQPPFPIVNENNIDMIASWTRPESHLLDEEFEAICDSLAQACRDVRFKPCTDGVRSLRLSEMR